MPQKTDPRVTKRKVTMRSVVIDPATGTAHNIEATDYVDAARPGLLDAYLADARRRWAWVGASDEPDAGPAGYDGATSIPFGTVHLVRDAAGAVIGEEFHAFPHDDAGTFYPASDCIDCDHAPEHPMTGVRARTVRADSQEG